VTRADVRGSGERDRESLRRRAAHAGLVDDDTVVYRIEFRSSTDVASGTSNAAPFASTFRRVRPVCTA